ncbi:PKD domain-containing protein, partial [Eudoraea chungangensis]|uniref:PKD domain-containing protein n=1 Tax=Eudoraea chungangensis TaxID=1481905 RepID=UPI0023EB7AA8
DDDGATSALEDPSHTFDTAGVYQVSLRVEDAEGAFDTATISITVTDPVVSCDPVPSPWSNGDIGGVGAAGDACYNPSTGVFEVEASGVDIWNSSDEFHYVYQPLTGDGEIIARVLSLDDTDDWAKAGVMMRNTNAANSAMIFMEISPNPQSVGVAYNLQHRQSAGTAMTVSGNNIGPVPIAYPHYVRLVREGNTFTGYASTTNGNWVEVGSRTITMGETIQVGLATTSHNDGVITTATYDDVSVTTNDGGNTPPVAAADSDIISGLAPLTVNFNSDDSTDDKAITS